MKIRGATLREELHRNVYAKNPTVLESMGTNIMHNLGVRGSIKSVSNQTATIELCIEGYSNPNPYQINDAITTALHTMLCGIDPDSVSEESRKELIPAQCDDSICVSMYNSTVTRISDSEYLLVVRM